MVCFLCDVDSLTVRRKPHCDVTVVPKDVGAPQTVQRIFWEAVFQLDPTFIPVFGQTTCFGLFTLSCAQVGTRRIKTRFIYILSMEDWDVKLTELVKTEKYLRTREFVLLLVGWFKLVYKLIEKGVKSRLSVCRGLSFNSQLMVTAWRCVVQRLFSATAHGPWSMRFFLSFLLQTTYGVSGLSVFFCTNKSIRISVKDVHCFINTESRAPAAHRTHISCTWQPIVWNLWTGPDGCTESFLNKLVVQ